MIFDHGGRVVSVSQKEHEQIYPKPGWVEHDANEIWARTQEVMQEALDAAGNVSPRSSLVVTCKYVAP
jgi:glycerol kinase